MSRHNKIEPINKNKALVELKKKKFIKNGRKEITNKEELEKYGIGLTLISYMNTKGIFKSGGYLYKTADEYFTYMVPLINKKYRVKYKNVSKMWAGNVKKITNDIINLETTDKKKTKYPVKLGDTILYYAKENYDRERYCCTKKYKIMKEWYDMFGHLL